MASGTAILPHEHVRYTEHACAIRCRRFARFVLRGQPRIRALL